ncbi:hypothetical protein J6590_104748, partial [Homalodisca vitripennis]
MPSNHDLVLSATAGRILHDQVHRVIRQVMNGSVLRTGPKTGPPFFASAYARNTEAWSRRVKYLKRADNARPTRVMVGLPGPRHGRAGESCASRTCAHPEVGRAEREVYA